MKKRLEVGSLMEKRADSNNLALCKKLLALIEK